MADAAQDACNGLRFTLGRRSGKSLVDSAGGVSSTLALIWKLDSIPACTASELSGTAADFFSGPSLRTAALTVNYTGQLACAVDAISNARLNSTAGSPILGRIRTSAGTLTALGPGVPALLLLNWRWTGRDCSSTQAAQLQLTFRGARAPVNIALSSLTHTVVPCGNSTSVTGPEPTFP